MSGYTEAAVAAITPGLERAYRLDEAGTLEHLLDVCQDAALGARLAAEIFSYNEDLAGFFGEVAAERDAFATHLAILLAHEGHADEIDTGGTFRGKLFHWRLQLAKGIRIGYREVDDRRVNLRIIALGSKQVLKDYEKAEGRRLCPEAREEVHRQAERIRATNTEIHRLVTEAQYSGGYHSGSSDRAVMWLSAGFEDRLVETSSLHSRAPRMHQCLLGGS